MFIQATNLHKTYDKRTIVESISLDIQENEILAVIGPNGAGKSTTLEMLVGLKQADRGEINYWYGRFKEKIGVQLQVAPFFAGLTASENLKLFAAFYNKKLTDKQVDEVLSSCGLYDAKKVDASKLSGGQQKRLAISIALIHSPELIFLDEPTAALDPRARQDIHGLIRQLQQQGKSVVFTSHDMDEVDRLATRVIMIDQGRIIAEGNPASLCSEHGVARLEELYLLLTMGGKNDDINHF